MRLYIQVIENLGQESEQKVVSIDETDHSETERQIDIELMKEIYPTARVFIHNCYHDEGKACPTPIEV